MRTALVLRPSTTVRLLIDRVGGSSSLRIVAITGVGVPTVYAVPDTKVKLTVSSGSMLVSVVGLTVTVAVAAPAAKVTLVGILA